MDYELPKVSDEFIKSLKTRNPSLENMEMLLPVTDKMLLENLIDEKNREIERLKKELKARPEPLDEIGWMSTIGNCDNVQEVYDEMVRLGFLKAEKF